MLNDLVYAARTLRRSPLLAVVAIATIALGIGASTAIFTVAEAVLLRPLPYRAADRLVVANEGWSLMIARPSKSSRLRCDPMVG